MGANAPATVAANSPVTNPAGAMGMTAHAPAISDPASAHFTVVKAKKRRAPAAASRPRRRVAARASAAFGATTAKPPQSADQASRASSNDMATLAKASTPNWTATMRHGTGTRRS